MSSHFESPRKVFNLGAGIVACASLTNSGMVAFMTGRPARIAIEPGTSAGGDPLELPRIAAQEIALLSKDFALVLGKEGTVWSVPLSDPTRVREIVRDIQTICPRPAGDSALAISEDGKVFVLSLGRGEVSARPVDVPGRTRAIHASDGAISLVADGDEGGQLRFYASSSLDRGPSTRVVLPRSAADFDQVRGGRVLSAVFKRSGTSLCVVMREGPRTEAKIIGLPSALADVAVTETSIAVAMLDGTLALYDLASLAAADEGFVAPVQSVPLGGPGRPRVVLATTIKGITSIWVGMTTGEVVQTPLVESAAPVKTSKDDTAVAPPSKSEMETIRQELEASRRALEASATELQTRTQQRDELQTALDAKANELQSRSDELITRTQQRDELQTALDAKAQELQSRSDELITRTQQRDELQTALDAKAQELQLRTEEHEQLRSEAAALKARADELDAKLAKSLEGQNALNDELSQTKAELSELRNKFKSSRDKRIEEALPERVVAGLDIVASILGPRRH